MPSAPKWVFDTLNLFISKIPSVTISETAYLSPSVKQLRLEGDFKNLHFPVGAFFDIRVSDTDARRYTVAQINEEKDKLTLIAHLHGKGVGSDYMQRLKVGETIELNHPRTEQKYNDETAEKIVFFGDETSLALASSFLPVVKEKNLPIRFIFELDEENKHIPAVLGLENSIVYSKNNLFQDTAWIQEHLHILDHENWQDAYYVLTGNVKSVQAFRKVIKSKTNGKIKHHGYWLEGKKGL
ncbi:FAD-binding oxidoreductase [Sphingobacterium corticibacterium]|uniref:Siderophore-interacting protein n=1 Tax=Sphingobacterium corticibacterium TaxID=2484746 RepID=A0A4Q6XY81_9SPHI|nr:FAD-binding oxidoreductase [Sphingobacterium corticibacterium]RZF61506.1 siderophore-interacting protein [Sphingobacterium corticibacterium]